MPDQIPPWLSTMRDITGTLESPGGADNPIILAWRDEIAQRYPDMASYCALYTHDSIAWCGLTVAYCMAHNGIRPVFGQTDAERFLFAAAWKDFGADAGQAQPGDVLVFDHHVTLCDGEEGEFYLCRGGNQSDSVNVSHRRKSSCLAVRRPTGAAERPEAATVTISSQPRCTAITATVFGGHADPNTSYYDGHVISDFELGVALPAPFIGARPKVRVTNGSKSVDCDIVDLGPWNTNDPYWVTHTRPQAESGTDRRGRHTNSAGIDLTPAAARAVGIDGKGKVDWELVGAPAVQTGGGTMPTPATNTANIASVLQQVTAVLQALQNAQPATTTTQPSTTQPQVQAVDIQKVFDLINTLFGGAPALGQVNGALGDAIGNLLNGKKTAIGTIGAMVTSILSIPGVSTALTSILPAGLAATPFGAIAMPIFLALAGWGVLGKMEKWAQGTAPPPK
jgi:hypothetical protein